MFAVILKELWDRKLSLAGYTLLSTAFLGMYIAIYPSFQDSIGNFQKLYESYPKEFFEALGIRDVSLTSMDNFLAMEMFSFLWPIMGLLLAASRAGGTLAGEIERGIIGFYLMLPLGRIKLFMAKYCAGLIALTIFTVVSILTIIPLSSLVGYAVDYHKVVNTAGISLLFVWSVYSFAMLVSALCSERSRVYMIVGGLLLGMYTTNVIANLMERFRWLQDYTIFHYYNATEVISANTVMNESLILFGVLTVLFTAAGAAAFYRRDISV